MYIKEVTYTDLFTGEERKKTLYFNLTQKELMDFATNMKVDDMQEYIRRVQENNDKAEMYNLFNALVLASYGERTNSGGFVKDDIDGRPLAAEFKASEAFSNFMIEMFDDPSGKSVNDFIGRVIPATVISKAEEMQKNGSISAITQLK